MVRSGSISRIMVVGLLMLLAACSGTRGGSIPYNVGNFGAPDGPKVMAVDDTYKLAPLDTVTVQVFQVADISRDYVVDQSGRITMPLIGRVEAVGLGTNELAGSIEKKLGEKYLRNPNVTVSLKDSATRVVTVDGSVRRPGIYPAATQLTLLQVIALAGGADELANPKRIAVFRVIDGKRMAAAFDLTTIRKGTEPDPQMYPGDTIIVDGSGLKQAQRDIMQAMPLTSLFFLVP